MFGCLESDKDGSREGLESIAPRAGEAGPRRYGIAGCGEIALATRPTGAANGKGSVEAGYSRAIEAAIWARPLTNAKYRSRKELRLK
jgi:hypothetical protein